MQHELDTARRACSKFEQAARLTRDGRIELNLVLDTIEALTRYQELIERS